MALLKTQVPMIRAEFVTRLANLNNEMKKEINNHQGTLISPDGKTNVSFNYDGAKTLFLDAHSSGNIDTGFFAKIKAIFTVKLQSSVTKPISGKNPAIVATPVVPPLVPPTGIEPAQGNTGINPNPTTTNPTPVTT